MLYHKPKQSPVPPSSSPEQEVVIIKIENNNIKRFVNGIVTWTPATAGTYYYQCSAHNGMYGTITVQ